MFVQVQNENYGSRVSTFGDYIVVANPTTFRYSFDTASVIQTGSVDYFRYNKNTDQHDYIGTLYRELDELPTILARETGSDITTRQNLHTELLNVGHPFTADKDIEIDKDRYTASLEDGFGLALDMNEKILTVGCPYFLQTVRTSASFFPYINSVVNIFDLGKSEYATQQLFNFPVHQTTFVYRIEDPDIDIVGTGSFGRAVSINNGWIAIGSPNVSSSNGMVYMYRNISTGSNDFSWSLYQKLEASGSIANALFGWDLKLNKISGSLSQSMIVGCGNPLNNQAYLFEFISGSWIQTFTFLPTTNIMPLTFEDYYPYNPVMNAASGFGSAVSIFGNAAIVGAPTDRMVYEYSGSSLYQQGSTYIFERCLGVPTSVWQLVLKTYGNSDILKNNEMGYSVDMFNYNAVSGIPKRNDQFLDPLPMSSCYIQGTIDQLHQCTSDLEKTLNGQMALIQKNTASNAWEVTKIYQTKKKFLSPYKEYGYDVAVADKSLVVGAPMLLGDSNRQINITITQSKTVSLDDITGKAYIYNLNNLHNQFHVGNVFYRNGKIVLMTSGSAFDGLFFNSINTDNYEYDLLFKGQHTIFEKQIICSVSPGEFNVSTNPTSVLLPEANFDLNNNGIFDFQDLDVILRYMQYKNTSILGVPVTTDWSSSIVIANDEISLLRYYQAEIDYDENHTALMTSASIVEWETTNTDMQTTLDLNQDNRIDIRDMNIMWKYFTNRLNQANYSSYITPACQRKLFSDIMDYLELNTRKKAKPMINPLFLDYERLTATDKTGSFLAPMATTIGLYSGLDLVMVAKLGTPIKITPELPINFIVKMDF